MLTTREAVNALYGAYRLARFDAGGMTYFEATVGGFWRSFSAAVFVAPLFAMLLALRYAGGQVEAHPVRFIVVEAIAYVVSWVAFPLAMAWLVRLFDRQERYIGYIVAYNWASVLQNFAYLPLAMAIEVAGPSAGSIQALGMVVLTLILVYSWFIVRTALDVPASTAVGLVILDLTLSLLVSMVAEGMI